MKLLITDQLFDDSSINKVKLHLKRYLNLYRKIDISTVSIQFMLNTLNRDGVNYFKNICFGFSMCPRGYRIIIIIL